MNTLRKLLSLLSRTPSDPRVIAIKNYVSRSSCRGSGQSIHLAVQGAEDPYFFGLFSTLLADLRAYAIVHADVIQIYGLGRALGMGVDLPPSTAPKAKLGFRLPTDQPCAVAEA